MFDYIDYRSYKLTKMLQFPYFDYIDYWLSTTFDQLVEYFRLYKLPYFNYRLTTIGYSIFDYKDYRPFSTILFI